MMSWNVLEGLTSSGAPHFNGIEQSEKSLARPNTSGCKGSLVLNASGDKPVGGFGTLLFLREIQVGGQPVNEDVDATAGDLARQRPFQSFDRAFETAGAGGALDELIRQLTESGRYRELLDALLLKARHELGMPLVAPPSAAEIPEPIRTQYEEKYVGAIRLVGAKFLEQGDIPTAWAYYRAIGEPEPVAQAIRAYQPAENDERLGTIIEIAFHHGVEPPRGFELILENYGTCPAISALEQLPPQDESNRVSCTQRLIRRLHDDLTGSLRADIAGRGQPLPQPGASIAELVRGRPWLFSDDGYHIDISHLAAVVRSSIQVSDRAMLGLAYDLTEYGRNLSPRLVFEGHPPFENIFADHGAYLGALLGINVDRAIAVFEAKANAAAAEPGDVESSLPAQTLVNLLFRLGRLDQAIDASARFLAGVPSSSLICPSLAQLCGRAGEFERLAELSRSQADLVNYAAARLSGNAG
jgi:hypothetical protein